MGLRLYRNFNRSAALGLCAGDDYSLFARAILVDQAPGAVFMDDPERPGRLAVLSDEEARCYLATGVPPDAALAMHPPSALRESWTAAVETVLAHQAARNDEAVEFHLPPNAPPDQAEILLAMDAAVGDAWLYAVDLAAWSVPTPALPAGYRVLPIDAAFRARADLEGMELLTDEWSAHRAGPGGISGMAVLEGQHLAALCHIDFMEGEIAEMGVITDPAHRRRGLASAAAIALAAYCRSVGMRELLWHAPKGNAASIACAERAGLARRRPIREYYLQARPSNRLLLRGEQLDRAGDHAGAAALYREALALELDAPDPFGGWASREEMTGWIAAAESAGADEDSR